MNQQQLKRKWSQVQGDVKRRWGKFTEDDLVEVQGNYDKLLGKIQERYDESRENIKKWIDSIRA